MKLQLACADFTFPLLPHEGTLELIRLLDFDGVDIGLFEGRSHLWPSQVCKNPSRSGARLARKLNSLGLRCADVFLQMAPSFVPYAINHPSSARRRHAREWFLDTLDFAAASGARHATTLPGVYFEDEPAADSWQRCCDELAWRVEQAKRHQLTFSVEAHIGSIVPTPKAALRLVRSVPDLTLTLDYTHFARCGVPDREVEPLVQHATHFHTRGACRRRLQASFKDNTIDYTRVLRAMRKAKYKGYLGVEYVWIDWEHCNEVDNLSETIQFRDFLRATMARIR